MVTPTLQHLDLKLLTGLLYLLQERSVSRAAQRLFISQSAMSRILMRLRELFDDPLFVRTSAGMEPTVKALELMGPLEQVLEQLEQLFSKSDFNPSTSRRNFRIQTTHYQAQAYIPAIAEVFYRLASQASLETITVTENSLLHQASNTSDLGLCSEYIQVPESFHKQPLGKETFRCVMSKHHPLAACEQMTLDDYLSYSHVLVNMGGGARLVSSEVLGGRAKERKFAFRTPYFMSALETVGRTQLLLSTSGLLPDRFCQQFQLVSRALPIEFPSIDYYVCWMKFMNHDPGLLWLKSLCVEVIRGLIPHPVEE